MLHIDYLCQTIHAIQNLAVGVRNEADRKNQTIASHILDEEQNANVGNNGFNVRET